MVFSPESIAISAVSVGLTLAYAITKAIIKKKLLEISTLGIVIPSNCGKSTLLATFIDNFGELDSNILLLDIEEQVYASSDFTDAQKAELDTLYQTNSHLYEANMMNYTLQIFNKTTPLIRQANPKKRFVVLASTPNIIKNLGINTFYSFVPNAKLQKLISTAENVSVNFIKYSLSKIGVNTKTTTTFSDFDDLFNVVIAKLKLKKN